MSKTLMVAMALAIGLSFSLATYAKADEKKPIITTDKKDVKKKDTR